MSTGDAAESVPASCKVPRVSDCLAVDIVAREAKVLDELCKGSKKQLKKLEKLDGILEKAVPC